MSAPLEADVVVVGSGVAGSLVAWRLAQAKLKVLILEAGPRIDRVEAFKSYLDAREKNVNAPYPPVPYAPSPRQNRWNDYYINTGPDMFRAVYMRGVGGSTWHWAGSVLRYRPSDFRMASRYGVGVDWPISYEELEPFYDAAEQALCVSGSKTETWGEPRTSDYPMPPIPVTRWSGASRTPACCAPCASWGHSWMPEHCSRAGRRATTCCGSHTPRACPPGGSAR